MRLHLFLTALATQVMYSSAAPQEQPGTPQVACDEYEYYHFGVKDPSKYGFTVEFTEMRSWTFTQMATLYSEMQAHGADMEDVKVWPLSGGPDEPTNRGFYFPTRYQWGWAEEAILKAINQYVVCERYP